MLKNSSFDSKIWQTMVSFLLISMLFFIPISPTLKSIFVIVSLIAIVLTPIHRKKIVFSFSQPWGKATVLFFLLSLIACAWSAADFHTKLIFIDKYSKLLYLPLFAIGFSNPKVRTLGMYAFLTAMLLTCVLSIYKDLMVQEGLSSSEPGQIFHNHIVTSFMMAFSAYLSCIMAIKHRGKASFLFGLLALLFSYQLLFINTGRAGYVLYFILMTMLIIQYLPLKYIFAGILSFCALFTLFSYQSHVVSKEFHQVVFELKSYQNGQKSSRIGYRIMFHSYAKQLFLERPWLGQGTGGFSVAVKRHHLFPDFNNLLDPHSQYWLVASEFGLVGLVALIYFFATLLKASFELNEMRPMMLGLLVSFFIANLSDSLLLYSVVGYLFIAFSALCLGEYIEQYQVLKTYARDDTLMMDESYAT